MLKQNQLREHHNSVAIYARRMAMLLCPGLVDIATEAALMHDLGKTEIDDRIIFKPGLLDEDEWKAMRRHPVIGADLIIKNKVKPLNGNRVEVGMAVLHHHERFDGTGYPDGIGGEDIPITARIIAVADTFDAMTTDRQYRKAMSKEDALKEIIRCSGTQFDPGVMQVLVNAKVTF